MAEYNSSVMLLLITIITMAKKLSIKQIEAIEARIKTLEWFGYDYEEFILNNKDSFNSDKEQTKHKEEYRLYLELKKEQSLNNNIT